jgi:hypothetical protein
MRSIWKPASVLAAFTGAILISCGPAGAAWSATGVAGGNGTAPRTEAAQQTGTNNVVSGNLTAVSCLTPSRCVAVGSQTRGLVVTLTNGKQSHAAVLRASSVLDAVGCRKSGCWAIGSPDRGHGVYLVKISSAGRPVSEQTVRVPGGVVMRTIWCASMKSCELAGADNGISPSAIEIGTWNGRNLRLHRVTVSGSKRMSMKAISCWHSNCEAVGEALTGQGFGNEQGLILTFAGLRAARLNVDSGYPGLDGVACISVKTCYATASGPVLTVTRGTVTQSQSSTGRFSAIECRSSDCEAAGTLLKPQSSTQDGWLQSLTSGALGASIDDGASYYFTTIAGRGGSGFIALGPSGTATPGTDVATG